MRALKRQGWVQSIRVHGRRNLLAVARLLALWADWDTLDTRPTWDELMRRAKVSERTVARWLQELRVRGWIVWIERGSTPATRPLSLAPFEGNRAAVYGLRIPLTPEEALHRAAEQLVERLSSELDDQQGAQAAVPDPACAEPAAEQPPAPSPESSSDQQKQHRSGDKTGSPPTYVKKEILSEVHGFSRASEPVDNWAANAAVSYSNRTALRAGSEEEKDWSKRVPASRAEMLVAADWLRHRLPVFAQLSRKAVRHLCKPYWRAGWCNRDVVPAMDHRPSVFDQAAGVLISPDRPAAPAAFIRSRLRAWCTSDGRILPGYWTSRTHDAAAAKTARREVAARHGRIGARLLRPGERTLTAERVAEHGRTHRSPASPATVAAARAACPIPSKAADRDRLRARLLAEARAEARAELARRRGQAVAPGGTAQEPQPQHHREHGELGCDCARRTRPNPVGDQPAGEDAYQRALDRARRERGSGPLPRRHRRRRQ